MAETWGELGDGNFFSPTKMTFFLKIFSILAAKISDDLFFLFSHRPGFSNFPSLLPDFPDLYYVRYRTQPFPHKKNTLFPIFAAQISDDLVFSLLC